MTKAVLFVVSLFLGIVIVVIYSGITTLLQHHPLITPLPQTLFSLDQAPTQSLRGAIASYSGKVQWQSRTATEPATLTSLQILQQGETVSTGDNGRMVIQFPNIHLLVQPQTSLAFIQTLPDSFVVNQDTGTVTYQKTDKQPLSVRSLHLLIQQNTGTMTVASDDDTATIVVTVTTGSITVAYNNANNVSTVQTVTQGKQFFFHDDTRQGIAKTNGR